MTTRRNRMAAFSMFVALLCLSAAACENGARSQGARAPEPPATTEPSNIDLAQKCTADSECKDGEVCQQVIRAACPTCEGGPVVQICQRAAACGDDSNCQAPRTCQQVDCPTCVGGKAGECR